jgi:ribonuclease G
MSKEIYISSTPHETRLAIVENDALAEIYYERENEYTLAGSIYNGRVTRVLPGMQSSFVDIGLERDAFLYITDFMEEAEDPADFEAGAEGGRLPSVNGNAERQNDRGGRGRNGGGGREQQPRHSEPRVAEPTDAELFTQAVSGLDPARPVIDGERVDGRGERDRGRRGGRNRGNRGGNRDGARPEGARPEGARPVEPERAAEPIAGNISIPDTQDEVGEGLPGADGSRRWRGRRGRRGNRGARPEGSTGTVTGNVVESAPVNPATGPVYDAYPPAEPAEFEEVPVEEGVNLEAAAATPAEQAAFRERTERGPRNERGGRDRNDGGGRNDGRRDRGAARVPRGFAPSTDLYKVESTEPRYGSEPEVEAPIEPIILPGESLSKYRAPGEQAASPAVSAPVAAVSEFVAEGWDGGFVLPGETIRPRNAVQSFRNDPPRGRQASLPVAEPVVSAIPEPVESAPVVHEVVEAPPMIDQADEVAEPVAAVTEVAEAAEAPVEEDVFEEVAETPREYEPEEASASYRVDPVAPREFRQTAPAIEEQAQEPLEEPVAEPEMVQAVEVPGELLAAPHVDTAADTPVEAPVESYEVTSISETGEMHSELVEANHDELQLTEDLVLAEPIAHEGAVVDAAALEVVPQIYRPAVPFFEPGTGLLEEEVLEDDDEAVLPVVEARGELYDQESLENAADLGTDLGAMLHDLAIDQMTGSKAMLDDDEDDAFEEDFLEEDQDYDAEDEEDDEDEASDEEDDELEPLAEVSDLGEPEGLFVDAVPATAHGDATREPRRDRERDRERGNDRGRRDGRKGDRGRRPGSGSGYGDRSGGRHEHGRGRQSAQTTNLPAISDLLKPGQEILVQIAKEPIAKKGARITSHIALPGRFLVFMPTVSHTGVSRKIESDQERRRLKEILLSERGEASGGFIVRTAAEGASEEELRSDLRFLLNLWADIKARSESSKSPALIYHDLNLIERVLRDQVTDNFSAIWVDSETEYERVLRFLQRFQPSLIRRVKLYSKETPMYEQFGITEEINKALRSKVWLKSGGSIVINQTEALVAIDINTGKFVGKTARLEDTIVKTNLDAIPEIVRQIRLRDLGGIIIIDFIDMDERKNRNKVMAALEEELKLDRAPSKVLQFNDFGLVAITRKRVKQSLERTLSTTCSICQGTGMVKSPVTVCNDIYVEMKKMAKHLDRGDVMLRVHPEVVKHLKAPSTHWLQEMEEMCGKTILVKSDPSLHPEQFDIH